MENRKKNEDEEKDLFRKLDEISDLKKNENKALKKIYDALQSKSVTTKKK